MLIKLTDRHHVAASTITCIEVDRQGRGVSVDCNSERKLFVDCDYGKTALQTRDRLVSEINTALVAAPPTVIAKGGL